ncbi:hypothetical protein PR003_g30415 [Phytophthora rubi]|uniref:Uncharacterized protein n=1 Tax=Phytophthora rubi TaxID=129364 RepID=A0A6A4BFL0_9STRA|nr:hypothetical protein PR002_g29385 [Phytophthora rubi]KAE8963790.1 hypothetical protein PR001_g29262 [Phytophthora rubi]KAE9271764.1 hypothetical protein PR003_g30415 [Phytophthora rubi]
MDFNNLYLFVGPPMTRGPPPVPLASIPLLPLSALASTTPESSLPPTLPRPPSSRIKNQQKQRQQLKPYHRLKSGQRPSLKHSAPMQTESQPRLQARYPPPSAAVRTVSTEVNNIGGEGQDYGYGNTQVKPQENVEDIIDLNKNFESSSCGLRMKMSDLDHAYSVPMNTHASGELQSIWTTVLEMCPQFLVLDPVAHDYY